MRNLSPHYLSAFRRQRCAPKTSSHSRAGRKNLRPNMVARWKRISFDHASQGEVRRLHYHGKFESRYFQERAAKSSTRQELLSAGAPPLLKIDSGTRHEVLTVPRQAPGPARL